MNLTLKQSRFCSEYVRNGGNASAAYRSTYDCNGSSETTIGRMAFDLVHNPKITTQIQDLEAAVALAAGLTPEAVLARIDQDRNFAYKTKNAATALRSDELLGKHIGMWPTKAEVDVNVSHSLSLEGLTVEEKRVLAQAARERLRLEAGEAIEGEYREVP